TLLNLASCAEREGKLALAWSRYRDARSLNADTKSAQQQQDIEAFIAGAIARLDPRIPQLTVRVAGAPPGLTIRRNGQPMVAGAALPVDPGTQIVEIEAPGYRTVRRELTLAESARETIDVQLETDVATPGGAGAVPPPALPPPPPVETES